MKNTGTGTWFSRLSREIAGLAPGPATLMEVCGTHTMAVARFGLKSLLPPRVKLVSGPGCPVCVTDQADIDAFLALGTHPPGHPRHLRRHGAGAGLDYFPGTGAGPGTCRSG